MKRIFWLTISLVFIIALNGLKAQETFFHFGAGYGLKFASGVLGGFYDNSLSTQSYTESQVMMSQGAGFDLDIGLAVYGDNGAGFSIRYSYLFGSTATAVEISSVSIVDKEIINHLTGRFSRITPAFTVRGEVGKVTPYMQLGPVLAWGNAVWEQSEDLGLTTNHTTWQYSGGFAGGAMAAAGLMIETGQIARVFIETSMYSMSWAPAKKIMILAEIDDDDVLQSYPLSIREVHYEPERTIDYNNPPNENEPDIQLRFTMPLSSIGIRAGIRLML